MRGMSEEPGQRPCNWSGNGSAREAPKSKIRQAAQLLGIIPSSLSAFHWLGVIQQDSCRFSSLRGLAWWLGWRGSECRFKSKGGWMTVGEKGKQAGAGQGRTLLWGGGPERVKEQRCKALLRDSSHLPPPPSHCSIPNVSGKHLPDWNQVRASQGQLSHGRGAGWRRGREPKDK